MITIHNNEDMLNMFDAVNTTIKENHVVINMNIENSFLFELIERSKRCLNPDRKLFIYTYISDMSFQEAAMLGTLAKNIPNNVKIYFYSDMRSFSFVSPSSNLIPYISLNDNNMIKYLEFFNKCIDSNLKSVVIDIKNNIDEENVLHIMKICIGNGIDLYLSNKPMDLSCIYNSKYINIYKRVIKNLN